MSALLTTQIPPGFFSALLLSHKNAFRLINDLRAEILPGFTYTGMLAFPATPNICLAIQVMNRSVLAFERYASTAVVPQCPGSS